MKKGLYKIAILISLATLISCILSEVSLLTGILRTVIVFIGTLFIFTIFSHLLRWGLTSNYFLFTEETKSEEEEKHE